MGKYDVKALFKKLSEGNISKEELAYLSKWLLTSKEDGLSKLMDEDWEQFGERETLEQSPKWMSRSNDSTKKGLTVGWMRRWVVAATILFAIVSGMAMWGLLSQNTPHLVHKTNTQDRKQRIELPDGSKVWLKRNSSLSYWQPFKGAERVFELDGEAFFEVATDSSMPFIVHANYLRTKVLGTSFNVISGKDNSVSEVALVEGSVEVSLNKDSLNTNQIILKPGEKARFDITNSSIISASFENDAPYAWKNDILYFQKADVYEVARILEAWYNIKFTFDQDSLLSGNLVHRFDTKKYTIEEVLNDISSVMPYNFHQQKNGSIVIKPK